MWSLFIAPTMLQCRFPEECYYKHFCFLIRILNLCLQFEISEKDINEIELGIVTAMNYSRVQKTQMAW